MCRESDQGTRDGRKQEDGSECGKGSMKRPNPTPMIAIWVTNVILRRV